MTKTFTALHATTVVPVPQRPRTIEIDGIAYELCKHGAGPGYAEYTLLALLVIAGAYAIYVMIRGPKTF